MRHKCVFAELTLWYRRGTQNFKRVCRVGRNVAADLRLWYVHLHLLSERLWNTRHSHSHQFCGGTQNGAKRLTYQYGFLLIPASALAAQPELRTSLRFDSNSPPPRAAYEDVRRRSNRLPDGRTPPRRDRPRVAGAGAPSAAAR